MNVLTGTRVIILFVFAAHTFAAVNHNTGTMVLRERLMTAKGHRLALPLTLNYDSGLKKSQRASWVGLGFDLDVPYIERTVQGGPDENSLDLYTLLPDLKELLTVTGDAGGIYGDIPSNPTGYHDLIEKLGVFDGRSLRFVIKSYKPLIEKVDGNWIINNLIPDEDDFVDLCVDNGFYSLTKCGLLDRVSHPRCRYPFGDYSNQHYQDDYRLHNFPAGGGQLFFTSSEATIDPQSLNAAVNPYRPWQIEFDGDWTITDENGIRYRFDKRMRVRNGTNIQWKRTYFKNMGTDEPVEKKYDLIDMTNDGQEYTWRWYLTKMTAYDGEVINIEYEKPSSETVLAETPISTNIEKYVQLKTKPLFNIDIELATGGAFATVPWYLIVCYRSLKTYADDSLVFILELDGSYRKLQTTFQIPGGSEDVRLTGVKLAIPWTEDESVNMEDYTTHFPYLFTNSVSDVPVDLAKGVIQWGTQDAYHLYLGKGDEYRIYSVEGQSFSDIVQVINTRLSNQGNSFIDEEGRFNDFDNSVGLRGVRHSASSKILGKIAYSVEDRSRTIIDGWYPKRINTALQEIVFGTANEAEMEAGLAGRPRLSWIEKKRAGTRVQRIVFDHQIKGVCGRLQLNNVYSSKASAAKERLYHFDYQQAALPGLVEDYFGTESKGYITDVTDYAGKKTTYSYEQGWVDRLSNNSELGASEKVRCGLRVTKVAESPQVGSMSDLITTIQYAEGEIPVTDAVRLEPEHVLFIELWPGLAKTLEMTGYEGWKDDFPLQMEFGINYGHVTVRRSGKGQTVFEYYNSGDVFYEDGRVYSLADEDGDRYHLHSLLRHRLKNVTVKDNTGKVVTKTDYQFSVWPQNELVYKKPDTHQREMAVVANNLLPDGTDRTFCLTYPAESYETAGFQGTAAATLVKSIAVGQRSVTVEKDGVISKTEYSINEYGQNAWEKTYKGSGEASDEAVIAYFTYGYETENSGFVAANLYSPIIKTVVATKSAGTYEDGAKETIRGATVEPWEVHWPGVESYKPFENFPFYATGQYSWRMQEDKTGTPVTQYSEPEDLWNLPSDTWFCSERSTRRSLQRSGQLLEMETDNGAVHSSLIYRHDLTSPIGQVSNSRYLECGVFTCDYQETGASNYDSYNAWERGGTELSGVGHFGKNTIRVGKGDTGPTRNFRLYPSTDYILSAWVKVNEGTLELSGKYRYFTKEQETEPQEQLPIKLTIDDKSAGVRDFNVEASVATASADWRYVELRIPARTDIGSADWSNANWYCRVSVGSGGGNVDALVEDIRFFPADAMVTTTYYDSRGRTLCSIDANNNPGRYTTYDEFDRITGTYKVFPSKDATSAGFLKQLTQTEHYRMGE